MFWLLPDPPPIIGHATAVDGDTINVAGERVRLYGIDAPEISQTCERGGYIVSCGQEAASALSDLLAAGPVTCIEMDRDRYGRAVATCDVAGRDLGREMVFAGQAIEYEQYSDGRYARAQRSAEARHMGLHSDYFLVPSEWRREHREPATPQTAPGQCTIKGNISRDGARIYHVPGSRDYEATRIDTTTGERWFCSAEEAQAAGWRARRPS